MWIEELMIRLNKKNVEITFDPHLFDRKECRNLDLDKVEETVRNGKVHEIKCEKPNKICFTRFYKNFIEVKTTWLKQGR